MLFQKRIQRALDYQAKKKKDLPKKGDDDLAPIDIMEKGDLLAMVLAALITIVPIALGVVLVMSLAGWLFMRS